MLHFFPTFIDPFIKTFPIRSTLVTLKMLFFILDLQVLLLMVLFRFHLFPLLFEGILEDVPVLALPLHLRDLPPLVYNISGVEFFLQ